MCDRCTFLGGLASFSAMPLIASAGSGDPQSLEIAMPAMTRISNTLWLGRLTPSVWLYTSTYPLDGVGYYPANGAIVVDGKEALLIDAAWNPQTTRALLDAWAVRGPAPVTRAIATHFHNDRTGGIEELTRRGIPAYGNPLTIGLAIDNNLPAPRPLHNVEKKPQRLGPVEVFYPGEGHTIDNVVAWIPGDAILFGGWLVKSTTSDGLGNVADANVAAWPATIRLVTRAYNAKYVIPGHGSIAGDSLVHTTTLADAANAR